MTKNNNWPLVKFGDLVRNVNENERNPLENGLERYVGLEHLDPESLHIKRWGLIAEGTSFTRKFTKGQVLFGKRRAYQRKAAVAEFDGLCSSDILVFEPRDDRLLPELLPFIVQTDSFVDQALSTSAGSLSPRTKWRDLANYEFTLPPKAEQRRIANILWAADKAINSYEDVLVNLSQLKDTFSFELFNSSGSIDNIKPCEELCEEITVGIVITPSKYYVQSGGVPAPRSLNVFPDRFDFKDMVYISEEAHLQHTKSRLNEGDVVVVRSGRPGDAAVVPPELDDANCIDLIIARPSEELRPGYLSRFLNSAVGRRKLDRGIAGTAQKHFNVTALKKLTIPVLTIERQDEIVSKLKSIDERIWKVNEQIENTVVLKKSLAHRLLGGREN